MSISDVLSDWPLFVERGRKVLLKVIDLLCVHCSLHVETSAGRNWTADLPEDVHTENADTQEAV